MISIFTAFTTGMKTAWSEKKLLLLIYLFNLFIAYLLALPVSMMLSKGLDGTMAAEKVLQAFDITIFRTLWVDYGPGIDMFRLLFTFGIFYVILNTFLSGGILSVIHTKTFSVKHFFAGCIDYFSRFLRLLLFSLLFIVMVFILNIILSGILGSLTRTTATEFWPFTLFAVRMLIAGMLLMMVNMLFDYAKIMTVVNEYYGMFRTIKEALMFVMMSLRKTISLYLLLVLTGLFLFALYLLIESMVHVNSAVTLFAFFMLSQVFMFSRVWLRLSFFSGQYVFYRYSNTAMPGMSREMLQEAVDAYIERSASDQTEG